MSRSFHRSRPGFGTLAAALVLAALALYFLLATIQGDYGIFQRAEIKARADALKSEDAALQQDIEQMRDKTRRLSDDYLDLELLDEQARDVLGLVREDEAVLR